MRPHSLCLCLVNLPSSIAALGMPQSSLCTVPLKLRRCLTGARHSLCPGPYHTLPYLVGRSRRDLRIDGVSIRSQWSSSCCTTLSSQLRKAYGQGPPYASSAACASTPGAIPIHQATAPKKYHASVKPTNTFDLLHKQSSMLAAAAA